MSLLQVQSVSKHFGSLIALNNISMTVEPGELRAIIGPNGAGKTTYFNLITGFFRPTASRIVFDGQDVTDLLPARRVRCGMARTFQVTDVFPELTVRENLRIAMEVASGLRLKAWLSQTDDVCWCRSSGAGRGQPIPFTASSRACRSAGPAVGGSFPADAVDRTRAFAQPQASHSR